MVYLFVALGGALGASTRYWLYNAHPVLQHQAGLATFTVNALGSFLMGFIFVFLTERSGLSPYWRGLVGVGFLGAFTTYSTYSLDALQMLERGEFTLALVYLLGTVVVCVSAVWLGLTLGRLVV